MNLKDFLFPAGLGHQRQTRLPMTHVKPDNFIGLTPQQQPKFGSELGKNPSIYRGLAGVIEARKRKVATGFGARLCIIGRCRDGLDSAHHRPQTITPSGTQVPFQIQLLKIGVDIKSHDFRRGTILISRHY